MAHEFCAVQHFEQTSDGKSVVVCDELYAEAPFVHLDTPDERVFAALDGEAFVATDGTSYPYAANFNADPEMARHANALYELTLEGGRVKSFRPAVMFPESVFVAPLMGRAYEGTVSRLTGDGQWADEASLPVRIEILAELVESPSAGATYQAKVSIENLDAAVSAADGSCLPALSSYGAEAPFPAGDVIDLRASRVPSMHGFGDDQFVFTFEGDGAARGTLMGMSWFLGPIDVVRGTLSPSGTYTGIGHGTPGSLPSLNLDPVEGGGEPCTP
jgi:hypothetical protein